MEVAVDGLLALAVVMGGRPAVEDGSRPVVDSDRQRVALGGDRGLFIMTNISFS